MPARAHPKRQYRRHFLKEWREFRTLSQEAAAERIGISRTQLSKIENLQSPYTQRLLESAAEAYGCEPADLVMRNPLDEEAPWSIYDSLLKAPEDQRREVVNFMDFLKRRAN